MASDKELSDFLRSVERRAFKRAVYAVRDDDAALDIVQDSMIRLAEKYPDRPAAELPLLFQRILSNATMDWFRRQKVRNGVLVNFSEFDSGSGDGEFDILETLEALDASPASEERFGIGVSGADPAIDRRRNRAAPRPSTRSLPAALLGGTRRRRNRLRDGLFGRKR